MSAYLHNAAGAGPRASRLGFAGAIAALLLATGCWEEVRYAGGPEPQRRPRSDAPAPAGPPTSTEPAEDRLIADDPSDEALPAAHALFDAPPGQPPADDAP
ncbi:MAG TPA: hypothetical protein PKC18_18280, partial [Lacipirellulaceae bacterium]|nr:hypothetical protein [Lacipirellulaceae bacterium]